MKRHFRIPFEINYRLIHFDFLAGGRDLCVCQKRLIALFDCE